MRHTLVLLMAAASLAGCGDARGGQPTPHPDVSATDSAVRLVDRGEENLVLHVSNQSFEDEEVRLTVAVDGITVVEDDFHVEGQHNWITFRLALAPGGHEITVEADSGASLRESFEMPAEGKRHAVVDHWTHHNEDSPSLTWVFQRQPLVFG